MAKNQFAQKHFHDEDAARVWFETARWPDGPICPNCGSLKHYATKKTGRYRCGEPECRKDFTVQTKSVMERSHAPLTQWAVAFQMCASSKKGFSAHQIVALVERGGNVRTFHVAHADKLTISKIVTDNISRESRLHTDESRLYLGADMHFASHETVKHSVGEYARGDVHTNSAEGYFSIFKRGMKGVYQHCKEKHLHRYLAEFDFRYNTRKMTDGERAVLAVKGGENKRLTYRQPH